jgi:poly(A) polymerase
MKAVSMSYFSTPQLFLPQMRAAVQITKQKCGASYVVGGWVRDAILGRQSQDLDMVIVGDAFELGGFLANEIGGTLVVLRQSPTIVRVVVKGLTGSSTIDITSLESNLVENLSHRDFTIDALALPLECLDTHWTLEDVIDPFGGLSDLEKRIVRVTGDQVFQDDSVRLLRGVRIAAQLKFTIDEITLKLMERDAPLLNRSANERVRDEFLGILSAEGSVDCLHMMDRVGLLTRIFPELEMGRDVEQPQEHYWDVLRHNIETTGTIDQIIGAERLSMDTAVALVPWTQFLSDHFAGEISDGFSHRTFLKLAGLLHDVGKPMTRTVESSGKIRFLGHQEVGTELAGVALRRLRISGKGVRFIETLIRHHLRPGQLSKPGFPPSRRAIYRYYRDLGEAALDTLYLNLSDFLAARGPSLQLEDWRIRCEVVKAVLGGREENLKTQRLVDGNELMRKFHLSSGPVVGRLLEEIEEAQSTQGIETKEEALFVAQKTLQRMDYRSKLPRGIDFLGSDSKELSR